MYTNIVGAKGMHFWLLKESEFLSEGTTNYVLFSHKLLSETAPALNHSLEKTSPGCTASRNRPASWGVPLDAWIWLCGSSKLFINVDLMHIHKFRPCSTWIWEDQILVKIEYDSMPENGNYLVCLISQIVLKKMGCCQWGWLDHKT